MDADKLKEKIRFVPKRERERLAKAAAEKAKQKEKEEEQAKQAKRKRDDDAGLRPFAPGLPPRPRKIPGEKMTADEIDIEAQYNKYLGPEVNKHSTFNPNKKRRKANDFNFGWNDNEDTTRRDPDDEAARERVKRQVRVAPDAILPRGYGYEDEIKALIRADTYRRLASNGDERAEEVMRNFYADRKVAVRKAEEATKRNRLTTKALTNMTDRDWQLFKQDLAITVKGSDIPRPMRHWNESALPPRILDVLKMRGFKEPTPIQKAAVPIGLSNRDLIGVAKTGSGKTLAFVLPLLDSLSRLPPITEYNASEGPYALILVPTRELANQIKQEAHDFAESYGFRIVTIVGGHKMEAQGIELLGGAHIIVATPGRLIDCIERRLVVFDRCRHLIMDEADRMIDLGFEEPVNQILDALPATAENSSHALDVGNMRPHLGPSKSRQTMMFTATMRPQVQKMAEKYLRDPAIVTVGDVGEAVDTVEQRVEFIAGEKKRIDRLEKILSGPEITSLAIVFVNTKHNCDAIARAVKRMGWRTATLHGGKTQQQREEALDSARNGYVDVLVATDLAGRGIDVPDVSVVINLNMSKSIEAYTHRIGRTGRAGKRGLAITFLGQEDADVLYDLKLTISKSPVSKVPDELARHEAAQQRGRRR